MLEKGKISAFQMGVMMYPTIIATAILSLPSTMAAYAKNDLWLSPIWASLIGFLMVYISYQLHQLYPKQTIVQYSVKIVGWIPGKFLGFIICFLYLILAGDIVRSYAEFIVGAFLVNTPISVIIASMVLFCACAVRGGVEGLGRAAQLFLPVYVLPFFIMIIMLIPDMEPRNILPFLEHGIMPSIKGAIIPHVWFGEFLLISFLLPFLTDGEKGKKWGMISVFAVMVTMIVTNLLSLFLFGGDVASMLYPVMTASRYISIADFFENLESVVMAVWVLGAFIKLSVFLYAIVLGSAQLMNVSDYRPFVWPIGFLVVLFSFWGMPSLMVLSQYDATSLPYYSFLVQTLIPFALLLIAVLRKKIGRRKHG